MLPQKTKDNTDSFLVFDTQFAFAERERGLRKNMLEQNFKKWRSILKPEFWEDAEKNSTIVYEIPDSPAANNSKLLQKESYKVVTEFPHLLSPEECEMCIKATKNVNFLKSPEIVALNFPEYIPPELKNLKNTADLMLVEDEKLAEILWKRVKPYILENIPTFTFTKTGIYGAGIFKMNAVGVCPLMRILKYEKGQQFFPHADGVDFLDKLNIDDCVNSGKFRSLLTLAIYLNGPENGDFEGGSIRFLKPVHLAPNPDNSGFIKVYDPYPGEGLSLTPVKGSGLIFDQDENHEGLPLIEGTKYMIQTSIMYSLE